MKRLSLQLSDTEKERLVAVAKAEERSVNDCIREAVRMWLENHK